MLYLKSVWHFTLYLICSGGRNDSLRLRQNALSESSCTGVSRQDHESKKSDPRVPCAHQNRTARNRIHAPRLYAKPSRRTHAKRHVVQLPSRHASHRGSICLHRSARTQQRGKYLTVPLFSYKLQLSSSNQLLVASNKSYANY